MISVENFIRAALAASAERREAALLVLEGQAAAVEPGTTLAPSEPYLSRGALAQQLGVSPWTIWRWQPPSHDLGGHPRYLRSEVEAYLRSPEFARRAASLRATRRTGTVQRAKPATAELGHVNHQAPGTARLCSRVRQTSSVQATPKPENPTNKPEFAKRNFLLAS